MADTATNNEQEAGAQAAATNDKQEHRERLLAALSHMTRSGFLDKMGYQYGTRRDIFKTAGYPKVLDFDDYWAMYKRGDIAGRVVDIYPQATWKNPPELQEEGMDENEGTEFTNTFSKLAKRLRLWSVLERADRLSGVGRYAVILIGVRGDDDKALAQPLDRKLTGPGDILYLSVFHEGSAEISEWVKDPGDPRFGFPKMYEIDLSSGVQGFDAMRRKVHASRLIHVAEDRLEDEVFGRPRMERIFNRLKDLEKVAAGTGEAFWQLASRILTGEIDADAELPDGVADDMKEQLEEIIHDLRRIFLGQGVDLKWLESTPPDPTSAAQFYMTLIAGTEGVPKRIFFGSETGERASEQDMRTFFGSVNERQERFAEPDILRALVDRFIAFEALPIPKLNKGEYQVYWPNLFELSQKELAEADKTNAEVAKILTPLGGDPRQMVTVDDDGHVSLKSTATLIEEGVLMAPGEEEPTPPPPLPDGSLEDEEGASSQPAPGTDMGEEEEAA